MQQFYNQFYKVVMKSKWWLEKVKKINKCIFIKKYEMVQKEMS